MKYQRGYQYALRLSGAQRKFMDREIRRLRDMLRLAMKIQSDATARDYAQFVLKVGGVGDADDAIAYLEDRDAELLKHISLLGENKHSGCAIFRKHLT